MKTIKFYKQDRKVLKTKRSRVVNDVLLEWDELFVIPSDFAIIKEEGETKVYFGFTLHDLPPYPATDMLNDNIIAELGWEKQEPYDGFFTRNTEPFKMAQLEKQYGSHSKALEAAHEIAKEEGKRKHEASGQAGEYKYEFPVHRPDNRDKFALSVVNCNDYFNDKGLTFVNFKDNAFGGRYRIAANKVLNNRSKLDASNEAYVEEFYDIKW